MPKEVIPQETMPLSIVEELMNGVMSATESKIMDPLADLEIGEGIEIQLAPQWKIRIIKGEKFPEWMIFNPKDDSLMFNAVVPVGEHGMPHFHQDPTYGIPLGPEFSWVTKKFKNMSRPRMAGIVVIDLNGNVVERGSMSKIVGIQKRAMSFDPAELEITVDDKTYYLVGLGNEDENRFVNSLVAICCTEKLVQTAGEVAAIELAGMIAEIVFGKCRKDF